MLSRPVTRLLATLALTLPLGSYANPPQNPLSVGWRDNGRHWQSIETEQVRIHYLSGNEAQARYAAAIAAQAHQRLTDTLQWQPRDKPELVLTDDYDLANGWATALPFAQSRLYLSPSDGFDTLENSDDWLSTLITHEYTHVIHLDKGDRTPLRLRSLFGRFALLFPNQFQPGFMIEGLAVHQESDAATGTGRAYSALYAGEMQAQADAGLRSISQVSVTNRRWPSGDGYLYGAFFMRFLSEQYGEDSILRLIDQYSGNLVPFSLNSTARQIYGKDFRALWQEYQTWLRAHFPAQAQQGLPGRALTTHGLNSFPPVARGNALYRIHSDGHGRQSLMRYQQGAAPERVTRVRDAGLFDVDANGRVIMASLRPRRENRLWSDLYLYDGHWQRLTIDGRYREARWLPDGGLLARQQQDGLFALHQLDARGHLQHILWQGGQGDVLGQFALAPDGASIVAAFKPANRSWQLARITLADGQLTLLTDNGNLQGEPSFAADGSLLFSADYDGRFDLYRRDQAGHITRLTDVSTGAFTPVQTADGTLYYQGLSASGYDLWAVQDPGTTTLPAIKPARRLTPPPAVATSAPTRYRPTSARPRWWLPVFAATEDSTQVGVSTGGSDALGQHSYGLTLFYETRSEEPGGLLGYQYSNRWQLLLERALSFSTADDQVQRVRASDSASLTRLNLWNAFDDRLGLHANVFYEQDSDRYRRTGVPPRRDIGRGLAGLALVFDNTEQFRYSISPAAGRQIALVAETNEAIDSDYSGEVYTLDWREYVHLGASHVLALRAAGAWGTERPKPIVLSDQPVDPNAWFGRDRYLLRGYPDDEIFGRRIAVGSAEWRFPLARIQRNWHTYPLGLRDLHGALFADTGAAWNEVDYGLNGKQLTGVGAELTTELVLGYQLVLPVRVGVARGLDEELGETRAYVSIGASF
ncbi:hypothetical protein S7S_07545 [Isoalcanivorax pacificus W11-5]|uniref:Uncharacterized protein n=1 Tax=Isoalcanivorax pacificus W11-5 TaxID=391936 RepID=A0A0B4XMP3_9GAMM|nr:hypothetical protein [Isoalcanivorax pacificus]AJD47925.1 hypothetical protein S7S_07545 [Isoalcanivorax pacificus W11-5]